MDVADGYGYLAAAVGAGRAGRSLIATPPAAGDPLLAGVRRLTLLADSADDAEAIFRTLARELLRTPGADEIHVHHLARGTAASASRRSSTCSRAKGG